MTGRVVGWARATGLLLALVSLVLVSLSAAPALADMTVGSPGAATPISGTSNLRGVACASATSCLAVGAVGSDPSTLGDSTQGVVVSITNGTPGAATPVAGTDSLNGVACSSATTCVAVGHKSPNAFGSDVGVVVPITNGIPGAATPVTGTDDLSGVACSSATSCVAVGDKGDSDAGVGVVVPVTNGIPGAATPVTGTDGLNGVACSSATSCLAVGKNASGGVVLPVTDGTPGVPKLAAGTDSLGGVACSSATSCLAVGSGPSALGSGGGVVVAITSSGIPGAAAATGAASLAGVACSSATSCLAVGGNPSNPWDPASAGGVVVTVTNGAPGATTLAAGTDSLGAVACASAASCLATEATEDTNSSTVGVVVPITYAPGVSGYRLTNNPFVVASGSTPESAGATKIKKHKKGTTFKYSLSEAATVKIVIAERRPGRRKHKRCVAPTRKLRDARKCTRLITRGTLARISHQGANSVAFTGRIGSTALTPGSYQATLTATDAAQNTSRAQTILFRIVKRSLAASAPARIGDAVIRDCAQDGELNHHYSDRQLTDALRHIPHDLDQFTDCPAVIGRALAASAAARLGDAVIQDCVPDGRLDHRYSDRQLRDALRHIPHEVDRFTSCRTVIETALQDQRGARVNPCRRSLRQELACLRTPAARRRLVRSVREARAYLRAAASARVEIRHRRPRVMASVGAVERALASCDAYSTAPSEPAERVGIALVSRATLMPVADILAALGRRLRKIHAHDPVLRSGARAWGDYADGAANLPGLPADAICGALTAWGARGYDPASSPVNIPAIESSRRRLLSRDDRTIARAGVRMRRLYIDEQRTQMFSPAGLFEDI